MQNADREPFQALLTDVMAFYRQDVSKFALSVWWTACQPFELEQVRKALTAHAMDPEHGQFAPKPADIVRQLQGTHTDRALVAWGRLYEAMRTIGAYTSVAFDDAAIHAAVDDLGGWMALCRGTTDELPFLQKRFCDAYRMYAKRPGHGYPAVLLGEHDLNNGMRGLPTLAPLLLGNQAATQRVIEAGGQSKLQASPPLSALPRLQRLGDAA